MIRTFCALALTLLVYCQPAFAGDLPDATLTPGIVRDGLTLEQICATDWGKDERMVTAAMRNQVIAEYHAQCPSGKIEIDHLIGRELGGADDVRNLWQQCYEAKVAGKKPSEVAEFGAHKKDRYENDLGKRICLPSSDPRYLTLEAARALISGNWVAAYIERYGDPRAVAQK